VLEVAQDRGLNSKSLADILSTDLAAVLEQQSVLSR